MRAGRPLGAAGWARRARGAGWSPGAPVGTGSGATAVRPAPARGRGDGRPVQTLTTAAQGFDALLATGLLPAAATARSVTEKLGIRYVYATYCPIWLPSPHHAATQFPGRPFPPDVTDNRVLWERQAQIADELMGEALNAHRASIGLPAVDNVYCYGFTKHPLAGGGPDPRTVAGADGPRHHANGRVDPAGRTTTPGRAAGVPGRRHATGVRRLRQHAAPRTTSPRWPSPAVHAQGLRVLVSRGGPTCL